MRINHLSPQFTLLPSPYHKYRYPSFCSPVSPAMSFLFLLSPHTHEVLQTLPLPTHTSFFPLSHCKVCLPAHSTSSVPASSVPPLQSGQCPPPWIHSFLLPFSFSSLLDLQFCFIPNKNKNKINNKKKTFYASILYMNSSFPELTVFLYLRFSPSTVFFFSFTAIISPSHPYTSLPAQHFTNLSGINILRFFSKFLPFSDFSSPSAGHTGHVICNIHARPTASHH